MPLSPIIGSDFVSVGYTTTLTINATGGVWSSTDENVATVSSAGVVRGVNLGTAMIVYTLGSDVSSKSLNVNPVRLTNGFNLDRILPAFRQRIGWHQPLNTDKPTLSELNKKSTSGRYYDRGFHKAVTVMNVYDTQETTNITDDQFNDYLIQEDDACTVRVLQSVFDKPTFIEHKPNYTRYGNITPYNIPNQGMWCGYRLNVATGDYAAVINSISLYFSDVATFNIYLFNDILLEPVYTKQVTTVANNQTRIQLEWLMNYVDSSDNGGNTNGNIGGVWYLVYNQAEVAASNPNCQAIDEQLNVWTMGKVLGAFPIQAKQDGTFTYNRTSLSVNFRSYGINIEYSCYRDYTQKIIQNEQMFDEARGLMMAVNVCEGILNGTRANGESRQMYDNLQGLKLDLDLAFPTEERPFTTGLKGRLAKEIKHVSGGFVPRLKATSVPITGTRGVDVWANYYQGFDIRALPPRNWMT